jgi:hypothetical protein
MEKTGRKHTRDIDAPPTASKRKKIAVLVQTNHHSLLLDSQPEINRKIYCFLMLKEALVLRQTHR